MSREKLKGTLGMKTASRIMIVVAAIVAPLAAQGADPEAPISQGATLWGVGKTNVYCYQPPCPWNGVFPITADGERGRPVFADNRDTIALSGAPTDIVRVRTAYEDGNCLIVRGRFIGEVLDIESIVGPC